MSERLTASLEDGTLEKLRELAGGERKVGAYLSQLVAWLLWPHREDLGAVGPLGCVIMRKDKLEDMPRTETEAMWRATQHLQAEAAQIAEAQEALKAEAAQITTETLQLAQEMREAYAQLMVRTLELEKRLALQQEDSSQNDA